MYVSQASRLGEAIQIVSGVKMPFILFNERMNSIKASLSISKECLFQIIVPHNRAQ